MSRELPVLIVVFHCLLCEVECTVEAAVEIIARQEKKGEWGWE